MSTAQGEETGWGGVKVNLEEHILISGWKHAPAVLSSYLTFQYFLNISLHIHTHTHTFSTSTYDIFMDQKGSICWDLSTKLQGALFSGKLALFYPIKILPSTLCDIY